MRSLSAVSFTLPAKYSALFWWPIDLARAAVRQIGDVARAGGCDSGFHRRIWFFAGSYALKEIAHVVDGSIAEAVGFEYRIIFSLHTFVIDAESAAIDLQRCLRAAEFQAAIVDGRGHHALVNDIESRIAGRHLNRIGTIPLLENI